MKYDYLIVGAGLYGVTFAHEASKRGKKCLIIDKRPHIGGNIYTENIEGINVHKYGAHIFHTSDKNIWDYINQFAEFNNFINSPIAINKNEVYNLPFNMNTFNELWGVITPKEANKKIKEEIKKSNITNPKNLEEMAISLVGTTIYQKLIKGYTEKQWGKKAFELPSFIIKRLPIRLTYDNNYFNDKYQGIPIDGYTRMIEKMISGIDVRLNCDFFENKKELMEIAKKIVFTGQIDKYYDYKYGKLEYRSLRFETTILKKKNFQGNAVINYTDEIVPYTRIIEHKHFELNEKLELPRTVITKEFPENFDDKNEPYYPINDEKNNMIYLKYKELADKDDYLVFGGRLGKYKYYDMDEVLADALNDVKKIENDKI